MTPLSNNVPVHRVTRRPVIEEHLGMLNVLIVDDIETDRMLATGVFDQQPDWVVTTANDGQLGFESIKNHAPDIVITDLMMPNMDGLELVRAITREYPSVPVVLMTSQGSEEIAIEALQSGAASYVPKRNLTRALFSIVERVMSASRDEQTRLDLYNHINRTETAELQNDIALISPLVRHLSRAVESFGVCGQSGSRAVALALDEALTNAIYHGNLEVDSRLRDSQDMRYYEVAKQRCLEAPYRDRRIRVNAKFSRSEAVISIADDGPGFDPSILPDPTDPRNISRPHGRGVMLMRTFMDKVVFNSVGNEVTLTKCRNA